VTYEVFIFILEIEAANNQIENQPIPGSPVNLVYNHPMNIRRYYYPGQIVFITQKTRDQSPVFENTKNLFLLKQIFKNVHIIHPFSMLAYVFLPDHFHILIRPTGNSNFSQILHSIKTNFTREYKQQRKITGNLNLWQKRFWDHVIRDETDLENHLHYIHYNPVKHGYVKEMGAWKHSSYALWDDRGFYDRLSTWDEPENSSWGE
jgi:putative transposase